MIGNLFGHFPSYIIKMHSIYCKIVSLHSFYLIGHTLSGPIAILESEHRGHAVEILDFVGRQRVLIRRRTLGVPFLIGNVHPITQAGHNAGSTVDLHSGTTTRKSQFPRFRVFGDSPRNDRHVDFVHFVVENPDSILRKVILSSRTAKGA